MMREAARTTRRKARSLTSTARHAGSASDDPVLAVFIAIISANGFDWSELADLVEATA
jgi:hypothetical protein